jgi:hypothetical protein
MDAMNRPPDITWAAPAREARVGGAELTPLALLPTRGGRLVRVAGYLHLEFEWVALYPSRDAMEQRRQAPWVNFGILWQDEPYWKTRGPSISGRCAVVEGLYSHAASDGVLFHGHLTALRLDVWSTPYRPIDTMVPRAPSAR